MLNKVENDNKILYLNLRTWNNGSNGIYDYASTSIKNKKAFIAKRTYIVRTKNNIFLNIEQHVDIQFENGDDLIFYVINCINDTYILKNPIPNNLKLNEINFDYLNNKIWYVLKTIDLENNDNDSNCNEEYYLNQNDIIKIGRVKYAVQKIHLLEKKFNYPTAPLINNIQYNITDLNKNLNPVFEFIFPVEFYNDYIGIDNKINEQNKCRYCDKNNIYKETDDGNNFLISVCKCQELVHYKCLKKHFKDLQEKNVYNKNHIIYDDALIFNDFECPVCHNPYPTKFKLKNIDKIFDLIEIKEPNDCNYMILESIDYKKNDKYCKSIHIIKLKKSNGEPFKIGNDNDNDIIDRDISISDHHAILRFNDKDGKISIQNWKSKYGTSILIRNPIKILDKKIYLQVGRTYIEVCLMDKEEFEILKKEINIIFFD